MDLNLHQFGYLSFEAAHAGGTVSTLKQSSCVPKGSCGIFCLVLSFLQTDRVCLKRALEYFGLPLVFITWTYVSSNALRVEGLISFSVLLFGLLLLCLSFSAK